MSEPELEQTSTEFPQNQISTFRINQDPIA